MKKTLFTLVSLLVAGAIAFAQDYSQFAEILAKAQTGKVSLKYSCSLAGQTQVKLSGSLLVQGDCYMAKGNGMEIYCNGSTRWTVDREAKEVYVEDAGGIAEVLEYKDSLEGLKVSDVKYLTPSESNSEFVFNTKALDGDWLITDLRE